MDERTTVEAGSQMNADGSCLGERIAMDLQWG